MTKDLEKTIEGAMLQTAKPKCAFLGNVLYWLYKSCERFLAKYYPEKIDLPPLESSIILANVDSVKRQGLTANYRLISELVGMYGASFAAIYLNDPKNPAILEEAYSFPPKYDPGNFIDNRFPLLSTSEEELGYLIIKTKYAINQKSDPKRPIRDSITDSIAGAIENDRNLKNSALDGLTQLYNRRHFEENVLQRFYEAKKLENEKSESSSLVLFDLDHFKNINDNYGHPKGDEVLRLVADIIKNVFRPTDFCARYGGEEIAVFLRRCPKEVAERLAKKVLNQIKDYSFGLKLPQGGELPVTASAGVCETTGITSFDQLKDYADQALYAAKHDGRNRVVVYNEEKQKSRKKANKKGLEFHIQRNSREQILDNLIGNNDSTYSRESCTRHLKGLKEQLKDPNAIIAISVLKIQGISKLDDLNYMNTMGIAINLVKTNFPENYVYRIERVPTKTPDYPEAYLTTVHLNDNLEELAQKQEAIVTALKSIYGGIITPVYGLFSARHDSMADKKDDRLIQEALIRMGGELPKDEPTVEIWLQ